MVLLRIYWVEEKIIFLWIFLETLIEDRLEALSFWILAFDEGALVFNMPF